MAGEFDVGLQFSLDLNHNNLAKLKDEIKREAVFEILRDAAILVQNQAKRPPSEGGAPVKTANLRNAITYSPQEPGPTEAYAGVQDTDETFASDATGPASKYAAKVEEENHFMARAYANAQPAIKENTERRIAQAVRDNSQ